MDPGTAAIATLATVVGVSGYGAMKVNSNQDVVIEQKVQERIAQSEERLKATQEALQSIEAVKLKQDQQLAAIEKELTLLRNQKAQFESTPAPTPTPEPTPQPTPEPTPEPTPTVPPVASLPKNFTSRFFNFGRKNPAPTPPSIPAPVPTPNDDEARERPDQPDEKRMRDTECANVLRGLGISSRKDFRKWATVNHPDKGGDTNVFQRVNECITRMYPRGGLRKKKLRTRRGTKQSNVGRTRRS